MTYKEWDESEHPRDDIGRFTYKNSGSSNLSKEEKIKEIIRKNNEEKARMQHIADILYPTMKNNTIGMNLKNNRNTSLGAELPLKNTRIKDGI